MTNTKSKFDYEIEEFIKNFYGKKKQKIILYGTGRMTATLLERLQGYHIVGLLDRDPAMIGRKMYGVKVLSRKEAEECADMIIINTSESYWNTIYQRICDWGIPIYFRNGEKAFVSAESEKENPYWSNTDQRLRENIEMYDLISFDVFNTLLMRRLYLPTDVFAIVEGKLQKYYGKTIVFVEWRKKASAVLDYPSIDDIYIKLKELTGWEEDLVEKAKAFELETELYFITPRHDMVELYQEISQRKEVFLISDMYYPREILCKLLMQGGIVIDPEHLLVSCDIKKTKESGELWDYYSRIIVKGRKAIHIGDEEQVDCNQPQQYGIDSWHIWSPAMLLEHSSLKKVVPYIHSLYASVAIGLLESKLFNSPFSLSQTKGKVVFRDEKEAGYCLLGNLVSEFFAWLLAQTKLDHVKQLAFFAREGYLLTDLFDKYCHLTQDENTPQPVYLEISRRVVMTAWVENEADVKELLSFPYKGTAAQLLKDRFGINTTDKDLYRTQWGDFAKSEAKKNEFLGRYVKPILEEAKCEKQNYIKYLSKLRLETEFAVVDSQFYGTIQYYLGKLMKRSIKGYYFCACLEESNKYLETNIMKGCFQKVDGRDSNVYKQAPFIEAFFTAPNGMLECIEEDGKKRYGKKMRNQEKFDVRFEMMEGILEFMKDIIQAQKELIEDAASDAAFADLLFGVFMNNGFQPSERIKESFWYDNQLAGCGEVPIWE